MDRGRNLQPGRRIRPQRLVSDLNDTTINERTWVWGLERPGDGMAASVSKWDFGRIFVRGGVRHRDFETKRPKAIKPPGPRQQQHDNQTMDERVWGSSGQGG